MWQYCESCVHRNPLNRDESLFLALFYDVNQVFLRYVRHSRTAPLFFCSCMPAFSLCRSDLDQNSCTYNRCTFEFQNFWITSNRTRLYFFKFTVNIPASLEINSQRIANAFHMHWFVLGTTHHQWWRDLMMMYLGVSRHKLRRKLIEFCMGKGALFQFSFRKILIMDKIGLEAIMIIELKVVIKGYPTFFKKLVARWPSGLYCTSNLGS